MSYEGVFKVEFDHSKEFGEMIREALFSGSYFFELRNQGPIRLQTRTEMTSFNKTSEC